MPVNVTLDTLRKRVRFDADMENSRFGQPSQMLADERLDAIITDALRATYDLFLDKRGEQFITQQVTPAPALTSGSNIVTLSDDFYRLFQVEIQDGGNFYPLRHVNTREVWRFQNSLANPRRFVFRHEANTLRFFPTPSMGYTLRIWYAPVLLAPSVPSSTFDGVQGFERLTIARAVLDLKMREGMPAMEWAQKVAQYTKEVMDDVGDADRGTPFLLSGLGSSSDYSDDLYGWWT
jgi:hypothetical protein